MPHPLASVDQKYLEALLARAEITREDRSRAIMLPIYDRADIGRMAVAVATPGGVVSGGDSSSAFTLMSAVKPFLLLHLLEASGPEAVFEDVGVRPSDESFYSVRQLLADARRPRNPMLNSGAMLLSDRLPGSSPEDQCARFTAWLNAVSGASFSLDGEVFDYMMRPDEDDNRQLARELVRAGLSRDADRMIDIYFRLCCLAGTISDAARLGLLLTHSHPALRPEHQAMVTAIMLTCGLYEGSPEWAVETGLPAKSGVSGIVIATVPGAGGLAAFSPLLAPGGNSIAARRMLQMMSAELKLGVFRPA